MTWFPVNGDVGDLAPGRCIDLRLKMVKRQMFGRVKLDLLASHILTPPLPTLPKEIHGKEATPLTQHSVKKQLYCPVTALLREWCYGAKAKRGGPRRELAVESCFAPLLGWVLM